MLIERWTHTIAFRVALFFSGVVVLPVLALGLLTTVWMLVAAAGNSQVSFFDGAPIALPSMGGALGVMGLLRAHLGTKEETRCNVAGTFICLAIGIATALFVAGFAIVDLVSDALEYRRWHGWSWISSLFAAAHVLWVVWGIGLTQTLTRRCAERTSHVFDAVRSAPTV